MADARHAGGVEVGERFPVEALAPEVGRLDGPAVVYFYPKDDTPTCTREAHGFNQLYDRFEAAGVVLVGVSMDSGESHRCFAEGEGLRFPLHADEGGALTERVGLLRDYGEHGTLPDRATFLLDRDGVVRQVWRLSSDSDVAAHPGETLAAAKDLLE